MDRLEAMEVFLAAVEGGSLSSAGRKLGIPLPTVSRKISELESHLSACLLERSTRKVVPTVAGRDFVTACKSVLQSIQEAESAVAGEYRAPCGELSISAPICLGRIFLLPIINEFLVAYPDVDVHLILKDRLVDLQEERIDLALRIMQLPDSSLVASRVAHARCVVCASPAYLDTRGRPAHPRDLAEHSCITKEGFQSPRAWQFRIDEIDSLVAVRPRLIATTWEAAIDAAIAGVGLTRAYSFQIDQAQKNGALEIVLEKFERAPVPVSFIYSQRERLPLKLRAFLDFARPRLRHRLVGQSDSA
jgi:DNA-binding transcriptional LysR family regulator